MTQARAHSARWRLALMMTASVPFALQAQSVRAEPLPAGVDAMLDAAAGDAAAMKTVGDMAKKAFPAAAKDIDAQVATLAAKAEAGRVARLEQQGLSEGWSGEGQAGVFNSTGNTQSTGVAAGVKFAKDGVHWRNTVVAQADYQRQDGIVTKERYFLGYDGNYNITPRLYAVGLLSWERDRIAGFTSRFSQGLGFGYRLFDTPTLEASIEGGPALRQTRFLTGLNDSSLNARVAGNLVWTIAPNTSFSERASYFIGGESNTLTSETALTTKVYGGLSARLAFFIQNESNPQTLAPRHRHDDPLHAGLRLLNRTAIAARHISWRAAVPSR